MTTFYDKPEKYFVITQYLFIIFVTIFKDVFIVTIVIVIIIFFLNLNILFIWHIMKKRK